LKPPGKTTLARMQRTAMNEAARIQISQDGRVREKMLKEPMPHQVELRDDFAGIVRLIDIIMSDKVLLERLQERMAARTAAGKSIAPAMGDYPQSDVAIDEEADSA
jgi:hypothetical protein